MDIILILVDDKKIAKRFNRLDPQSAKAMPATGNPHIDKKVRAAAKKPKIDEEVIVYSDPQFCNWREETDLKESEWTPISGSGPTNSASQTFEFGGAGGPQFTANGLGGQDVYPQFTSLFGDPTPTPFYSDLALQGYTPKLNPRYEEAQKKYEEEMKAWRAKEDANFKAIKDTLKSFGTSWNEMRASKKWVKKLSDGTVVALVPTDSNSSPMNWTNNVRVIKLKECVNASGPMTINYNPPGQYQDWVVENSEIQSEVYLQIGKQPKAPMEQEYLMPRRTEFNDINPQLDASQEFAQEIGADYMMGARVQDTSPTPAYYPTDQSTVPGMVWIDNPMSASGGYWDYDSSKMGKEIAKVASVGLTQQDQEWLNGKQSLVNKLKIATEIWWTCSRLCSVGD